MLPCGQAKAIHRGMVLLEKKKKSRMWKDSAKRWKS